jgi:hypothetical protein
MKITKKQLDYLIEKTLNKVIHEQLQKDPTSEFDRALSSMMGRWDHEGAWAALETVPQVTDRLKTLKLSNPTLVSKIVPLWQQLVKQVKRANSAEEQRNVLDSKHSHIGDEGLDDRDQALAKISNKAWSQADELDRQIAKIVKRHSSNSI